MCEFGWVGVYMCECVCVRGYVHVSNTYPHDALLDIIRDVLVSWKWIK